MWVKNFLFYISVKEMEVLGKDLYIQMYCTMVWCSMPHSVCWERIRPRSPRTQYVLVLKYAAIKWLKHFCALLLY